MAWLLAIALGMTALGQSPAFADDPIDGTSMSSGPGSRIATADSDPTRASTSFPVTGTLTDTDGSPIRNAGLAVYLDPDPAIQKGSASIAGVRLAVTRTNSSGDFRLEVPALKNISAYVDAKGQVTLQFMSFGEQHSMLYQQKVKLPSAIGRPARAAVVDGNVFPDQTHATNAPAQGGPMKPALAGMRLTAARGSAGPMNQPASEGDECTRTWGQIPWGSYWWIKEGNPIKTWVPVQRAQTGNKTTMTYDWSNSSETSVEVAVNFEYKSVSAGGGFTDASEVESGVPFAIGHNTVRDLEVEFDFYTYRLWCSISGDVTNKRDAQVTKALPEEFTGGNRHSTYSGYYSCLNDYYRTEINSPLWVSRTNTTTLSGSFAIYGIGLAAKQVNTESHKKTYIPAATPAYLCGMDGNPVATEKVSEVSSDGSGGGGGGGPCNCGADTRLMAWGDNYYGQLGLGVSGVDQVTPQPVINMDIGVTDLDAGGYHYACAVQDGGAKCWGNNWRGQLGNGNTGEQERATPVQVVGLATGVTDISTGGLHTCAIQNGAAKCWGDNYSGQVGNGNRVDQATPVQVVGLTSGVTAISAGGGHTCAIQNGAAKCWGDGWEGQLGHGSTPYEEVMPVQVTGLTSGVTAIAAGGTHTCAVHGGELKCWGNNHQGQLGNGNNVAQLTAVGVSGMTSGVTTISVGADTSCAIQNGAAKCWGNGTFGQIGDGVVDDEGRHFDRATPVQVVGLTSDVTAIDTGSHSCAVHDRVLKCWGYNNSGELGDGTDIDKGTPVQVLGMQNGVTGVSVGGSGTFARQ